MWKGCQIKDEQSGPSRKNQPLENRWIDHRRDDRKAETQRQRKSSEGG